MAAAKKTTTKKAEPKSAPAPEAHAILSASSAHRWLACPPSAVAALAYADEATDYAKEGTTAHAVAAALLTNVDVATVDGFTTEMVRHAEGYRDYVQELKESDDAVVLVEQRVDFSPWVPNGFGTCDCIIIQGDLLRIVDYKYGVGVPVSALDNPQMKLYALGALNDYGFAYDVKRVEVHIYQPRINNISSDSMTVDELLAWAEAELKPTAKLAAKGKGKYEAGAHCKFCPHAARCRKLAECCKAKINDRGITASVPTLAPWEVAEILETEPLISLWLKRVKTYALETLLDGGEIPGFKVVEGRSSRAWADDQRVIEILKDNGYGPNDYFKSELYSPAGMEGQLGKKLTAELLGGLVVKKPGSPAVVPETDRREPISRLSEAQKDFE